MPGVFELLGRSVRLYRAHVSLLAGFSAWALLPAILGMAATLIPDQTAAAVADLVSFLLEGTALVWASVAIMRATRALNAGTPVPDTTLPYFGTIVGPLLTVAVLQTAASLGGLILFIIPGIIAMVWFAFGQQAVVLDGARPLDALSQSRALVTGRFFRSAWWLIGGPLIVLTLYTVALSALFALVAPAAGPASLQLDGTGPFPLWAEAIDSAATILLIFPLTIVYSTLLYDEMKKKRA